jgi:hypothetical protein
MSDSRFLRGNHSATAAGRLAELTVTRSLMAIFGLYENVSGEIDSGMRFSPPSKGDRQRRTRLYAAVAA